MVFYTPCSRVTFAFSQRGPVPTSFIISVPFLSVLELNQCSFEIQETGGGRNYSDLMGTNTVCQVAAFDRGEEKDAFTHIQASKGYPFRINWTVMRVKQ